MGDQEQAALVSQHGVLSHEELKAQLIGNSLAGVSQGIGKAWVEFNDPNGTSSGCYLIKLDGDKATALDKDGSIASDYHPDTILQGNPEGL
jgi:hypothetical protein